MDKEAQEKLAEFAHLTWQRWMAYMLTNIDNGHIERWKRQANTAYKDLPESEKESDRSIAQRYHQLFEELGYRKLPKDKPPLLNNVEILKALNALLMIAGSRASHNKMQIGWKVAQAQREADIKHYEK